MPATYNCVDHVPEVDDLNADQYTLYVPVSATVMDRSEIAVAVVDDTRLFDCAACAFFEEPPPDTLTVTGLYAFPLSEYVPFSVTDNGSIVISGASLNA